MKAFFKLSIFILLVHLLTGCGAQQTPETIAQTLIKHYQSGEFKQAVQLFLPQSDAYRVAEVIDIPKGFLRAGGVTGEADYKERIANVLKAKRNSLKISWKQVKFEKLEIKSTKKHLASLETLQGVLLLKGKVMFQQAIKLVKFQGSLYLWEVGELDRYRASKLTLAHFD
ncbi:hypothetical protein BKI52_03870 [marine bacterium AO1-C]|nr:hypothetical protein BKI52_03870 [marine bacterium AO1-C]